MHQIGVVVHSADSLGTNWSVEIKAGSVENPSMAGLLGRKGLFENFVV